MIPVAQDQVSRLTVLFLMVMIRSSFVWNWETVINFLRFCLNYVVTALPEKRRYQGHSGTAVQLKKPAIMAKFADSNGRNSVMQVSDENVFYCNNDLYNTDL